jgi:hypothetical protein
LPDGRVLITGGYDSNWNVSSSAEIYDPTLATFTVLSATMTTPRYNHTATLLSNGKVILAGGIASSGLLPSAELFDPSTGSFTLITGAMSAARYSHTATLLTSGKVLLVGGYGNSGILSSAEVFDPTTGTFSISGSSMTTAREAHTATLLQNGSVLIAGGVSLSGPSLNTGEIFDPSNGTFSAIATPMIQGRQGHTAVLLPTGQVLIAGGLDSNFNVQSSAERYDPITGSFVATASAMASPREYHTATLLPNGQVLLAGGDSGVGSYSNGSYWADGELYSPSTDNFVASPGFMWVPRTSHTATLMPNGQVLFVGGFYASNPSVLQTILASAEIYDSNLATLGRTSMGLSCTVTNAAGVNSDPGALSITVVGPVNTPTITVPGLVGANQPGYSASVVPQPGFAYAWTITNGAITSGSGSSAVTFTAGVSGILNLGCTVTNPAGTALTSSSIVVVQLVHVAVDPPTASIPSGTQTSFLATVVNSLNVNVTWSVDSGGGYFKPTNPAFPLYGTFVAPFTSGTVVIRATSVGDPTQSATATVTLTEDPNPFPMIHTFTATPGKISTGQSSTLLGDYGNGTGIVQPGNIALAPSIPFAVTPAGSNKYTLTVTSLDGTKKTGREAYVGVVGPGHTSILPPPVYYPRIGFKTLLDREGRVLLIGGQDYQSDSLTVERFDPGTSTWSTVGRVPVSYLDDFQASLLPNGKLLLMLGRSIVFLSGQTQYDMGPELILDPETGTSTKFLFPAQLVDYGWYSMCLAPLNDGRVLVAGGMGYPEGVSWCIGDCFVPKSSAFVFDPDHPGDLAYINIAAPMNSIQGPCKGGTLLDGRVLVYGQNAQGQQALEVFDPQTYTFTLIGTCAVGGLLDLAKANFPLDQRLLSSLGIGSMLPDGRMLSGPWDSALATYDPANSHYFALQEYVAEDLVSTVNMTTQTLASGNTLMVKAMVGVPEARLFDSDSPLVVTPAYSIQNLGLPVTFAATGPDSSSGITWSASGGTITGSGSFSATQTGVYQIKATSGTGKVAFAQVSIVRPVAVQYSFPHTSALGGGIYSPTGGDYPNNGVALHVGFPWPLKAEASQHPNKAVTWSLQEGAPAGTISPDGVFTATSAGPCHVVATSVADPTKTATLLITVKPPITLSITPASITTNIGSKVTFTANEISGDNVVEWSSNGGVIPYYMGEFYALTPGVYTIKVVSKVDPTKSATATVTVVPIISATLSPSRSILGPNEVVRFKALINTSIGTTDISGQVTWTTTGGSISHTTTYGYFQAPSTPGVYTIQAFLTGSALAQATVTVLPSSSFGTANSPTIARGSFGFVLTRLLDGRVLITGGSKTAEIYNPFDKTFRVAIHPMLDSRSSHSATLLPDGRVLLVGGGGSPATAELFDPATETFAYTANGPLAYLNGQAAVLLPDGKVLIAGGDVLDPGSNTHSYRTLELYDPISGSFLPAGFLTSDRRNPSALLLADGRVLIAGGDQNYLPNTVDVFDFKTGSVTSAGPLQSSRQTPSLVQTNNGSIWTLGSQLSINGQYPNEYFDPTLTGPTTLGGVLLGNGSAGTELVDGSIWFRGLGVDPLDPLVYGLNNYKSMRFYPGSGSCEITQTSTSFSPARGYQQTLLPTGEVLNVGEGDGYQDAKLYISDTARNLVVFPRHLTLVQGRSWPFLASATGLTNSAVTWSIQEGGPGGAITPQGSYTAPFVSGTYHIVATSVLDGTVQASALVDVIADIEILVTPSLIQLQPGATQTFLANLVGVSNLAVTWSSSAGNISASGSFTAPMTEGTYSVKATSVAQSDHSATATVVVKAGAGNGGTPAPVLTSFASDAALVVLGQPVHISWATLYASHLQLVCTTYMGYPGQFQSMDVSGQSSVTLYPSRTDSYQLRVTNASGLVTSQILSVVVWTDPVSISITPTSVTLYVGGRQDFGYGLSAPTNRVVWTCTGGSITQGGAYTAPTTAGTYQVRATSVDDPSKVAISAVIVKGISLTISPTSLNLVLGMGFQFGYVIDGPFTGNPAWSASGGAVTQTGYFTAPLVQGTYTVAVSLSSLNLSASATVTVAPVSLTITPTQVALVSGQAQQFGWSLNGGGVTFLVLEAGGGSITQAGLYTAPSLPGIYTVQATSTLDTSKIVQANVTVNSISIVIDPPAVTLEVNQIMRFGLSSNNGGVAWSATGGMIDDQGYYKAPLTPGVFTVTARSLLDPTKTATSQVTVVAASSLRLSPNDITISSGGTIQLDLVGVPDGAVMTLMVDSGDGSLGGGTISPSNVYTAGNIPGTHFITAGGVGALAQVTILSHRILPEEGLLGLGQQLQFTADIYDASPSVTWSISESNGGSIDGNGLYTAPLQQGQYHIIAQTSAGNLTTVPVIVGPPDGLTVSPEVNILVAGTYEIRLRLKASNGNTTESLSLGDYPAGIANPVITFSQGKLKTDLGVDGPYTLDQVLVSQLLDGELLEVDRKEGLGISGPYSIAEGDRPWISIGNVQSVLAEDSNGNGLIDTLKVQIIVEVICDGTYSIGSGLVEPGGLEVGRTRMDLQLKRGTNTITLGFDGKRIYSTGKEGPYGLAGLTVSGPVTRSVDLPGIVAGFTLNQFEH